MPDSGATALEAQMHPSVDRIAAVHKALQPNVAEADGHA